MGFVRMHSHLGENTQEDKSSNNYGFLMRKGVKSEGFYLQGSELASGDSFCLSRESTSQTYHRQTSLLQETGSSLSMQM